MFIPLAMKSVTSTKTNRGTDLINNMITWFGNVNCPKKPWLSPFKQLNYGQQE